MRFSDIFVPREGKFLELLTAQADLTAKGLALLQEYVHNPSEKAALPMTLLEADGDAARRSLVEALNATFVTPFDREDIFSLSRSIDDILDLAENALIEMILFEIKPNQYLKEMVDSLREATTALGEALKKIVAAPRDSARLAIEAKKMQNQVESLHRHALVQLFETEDVREMFKVREIYEHLSRCSDIVDQAADLVAEVVVKRT